MKQYVVVYWRNDGEYHSKFEYTPHYVFKARNDTQALHIAMAIGSKETRYWSDFFFDRLVEAQLRGIVEEGRREIRLEERIVQVDKEQMNKDLHGAKYSSVGEQYKGKLQEISYGGLIRDFLSHHAEGKKKIQKRIL